MRSSKRSLSWRWSSCFLAWPESSTSCSNLASTQGCPMKQETITQSLLLAFWLSPSSVCFFQERSNSLERNWNFSRSRLDSASLKMRPSKRLSRSYRSLWLSYFRTWPCCSTFRDGSQSCKAARPLRSRAPLSFWKKSTSLRWTIGSWKSLTLWKGSRRAANSRRRPSLRWHPSLSKS